MKCEQAELLMAELLAGEIRTEERPALEAHLVGCAACRADFATARAGFQVEWPETAPSPPVVRSTLTCFDESPAILRFLRFGTAAAAAIAATFLILLSGGRPTERPAAVPPATSAPRYLASIQEAVVGSLVAKDEEGRPAGELGLASHVVSIEILDGIAKTTVEENFRNHTDRRLEGTFLFPLPPDASISRLALEVNGKIEEGTCLERERAREVFEGIVRRMKDPALLEWMPGGIFQCRIFPIEPRATKRVIVAYTQALPYFKGTMTYVYPLASEKTKAHPPEELRIDVAARFAGELKRIESPSHRLDVQRARPSEARASFTARNLRPENDFVLTIEMADDELRLVPHKADGDDGYFALFLTPRGAPARMPGRYAFVLDVSASVTGPELEVERRVVRAMMERRIEGDRFEILAHHIEVERSGEVDLHAANDFMDRLSPVGGCDLLKALQAAPQDEEIIYVGGGTPTFGETDTAKILEAMNGRRVRAIGVGSRANAALLEKLGGFFRISPNDDVNKRCAEIAATLGSPALSEIKIDGGDAVYDVVGARDIFYGERLVVTGRYRGPAANLIVTGQGYRRELHVALPTKEEGNNYVRRLWAQRKIADLLALPNKKAEITELGVKHQIMTPYTSFLVLENEQMWKDHQLKREVQKQDEVLGRKEKSTDLPDAPKVEAPPPPAPSAVKPPKPEMPPDPRIKAVKVPPAVQGRYATPGVGWSTHAQTFMQSNQFGGLEFSLSEQSAIPDFSGAPVIGRGFVPGGDSGLFYSRGMADDRDVAGWEGSFSFPSAGEQSREGPATLAKSEADMQVYVRQMEARLAEAQELSMRLDEHRARLTRTLGEKASSSSDLQFARHQVEKLSQDLAELEGKHIEMARDKAHLEEKLNHLNQLGVKTDVAPRKPLEAKVTAVAPEIGLVVISIGKDDGVLEGDEFTVYRGGDFVAKIQIDRSDRRWSAGKIVLKKTEPRVADDVANHIYVSAPGQPLPRPLTGTEEIDVESVGDDGITLKMPSWYIRDVPKIFAISRDRKFVALVQIVGSDGKQVRAASLRHFALGRVQAGDKATLVIDVAGYLHALPEEVRQDLASRKSLAEMRVKMGY